MKTAILFIGIFILPFSFLKIHSSQTLKNQDNYTYLALGDSYTIGESVPSNDNFPNQTANLMRRSGFHFDSPEIIAKTGWTTDELQGAIDKYSFKDSYNFVTLLIGVNNQYRGRSVEDYAP